MSTLRVSKVTLYALFFVAFLCSRLCMVTAHGQVTKGVKPFVEGTEYLCIHDRVKKAEPKVVPQRYVIDPAHFHSTKEYISKRTETMAPIRIKFDTRMLAANADP